MIWDVAFIDLGFQLDTRLAEYGHILYFPDKLYPLHQFISWLPTEIHGCQRAKIKLFLVEVDFVDSVTIQELYILISISEISDESLVSRLNLILLLLV